MNRPRISVVITCFDYEDFVAEAITSALEQDPPPHEVVVVDDGSRDGSLGRIEEFGTRVRVIAQANAGQAVALSAGIAATSGDLVVTLDADDRLVPGILATVGAAFAEDARVVKVHWRLALIDETGRRTGAVRPPRPGLLADGDLRRVVLRSRNHAWPPTSANAFRRDALARVLPIPPEFAAGPDKYLAETIAILGRLRALDDVGTEYRVHATNKYAGTGTTADWARLQIAVAAVSTETLRRLAPEAGLDPGECPDVVDLDDPALVTARLVSLRLDPGRHPLASDRPRALARRGLRSLRRHHALAWRSRAKRGAWFVAVGYGSRPIARRVIARWTPDAPDHLTR